jgi:opacity protein-like surface antigen
VKRAVVVGLTVFAVMALPVSARADTAKSIVETIASAAFAGIICSGVALTADDEIDPEDFARRGWLIGVGGSYAIETFQDDAESNLDRIIGVPTRLSVDNSFGFNGRAGYRCHRRFSAEFQIEWLDAFESEVSSVGFGEIAEIKFEPIVYTANFKGYLLTGRYQPFLLLGAGMTTVDAKLTKDNVGLGLSSSQNENSFTMRFGGGIDLYATKNVVVSLQADYVRPFGNLDDLTYVSIGWGLQYRF